MSSSVQPIGVFDSGIGGLTVLRRLLELLPDERYVYLGDTARVPYGNKSADTIQRYALECVDFLLGHNVKMIVVACNTASALALNVLRNHTSVPIVGMIRPAAEEAVRTTANKKIGIIGTRATVASNAYALAIQEITEEDIGRTEDVRPEATRSRTVEVVSRPCPLFVPLVEEGWIDTPATRLITETYLQPLIQQQVDTLVLGCTHYPMLTRLFTQVAPTMKLVDCGYAAAREATAILGKAPASETQLTTAILNQHVSMFLTDYTPSFQTIAKEFLGASVEEPVRTVLRELC